MTVIWAKISQENALMAFLLNTDYEDEGERYIIESKIDKRHFYTISSYSLLYVQILERYYQTHL